VYIATAVYSCLLIYCHLNVYNIAMCITYDVMEFDVRRNFLIDYRIT